MSTPGWAASLLLAALWQPVTASPENEAEQVLNRYALAFALHYLCGRNPLAQGVFGQLPARALDERWAADFSPALMQLAGRINRSGAERQAACAVDGPFADQYPVVELSDSFLRGLRELDRRGSALLGFENGTWFRLTGYHIGFEGYVREVATRLAGIQPALAGRP